MSDDLVRQLLNLGPDDSGFREVGVVAATALTEVRAEIERLRGEVYVPGQWRCAKCKFVLQQANLNAHTGTVTARDAAGDKCPNCNSPLWRVTWKQDAHEMLDRATEQMERAKAAESELSTLRARVREVVGPFAEIAGSEAFQFQTREWKDLVIAKPTGARLAFIQTGLFRAARQLMEEVK